jgi:hypothetical protein
MSNMNNQFQLLPSHHIDKRRWDACVEAADNGLIYTDSRFLDTMADNWSGIIFNDYTAIMPLPWKKKWGIRYAYVPPFMQQLGVTGIIPEQATHELIKMVNDFFLYGDLHLNFSNQYIANSFPFSRKRNNCIVQLHYSFETLLTSFSGDAERNLQKASRQSLHWQEGREEEAIDLFRNLIQYPGAPNEKTMDRFKTLFQQFSCTQQAFARCICNDDNKILAAMVGLKDGRRIYNLLNITTAEGRKKSANYFLFENLLKEWSGSQLLFDLEGSELPGVESFYRHWGGIWENYYHVHLNRLPLPIRWLKS